MPTTQLEVVVAGRSVLFCFVLMKFVHEIKQNGKHLIKLLATWHLSIDFAVIYQFDISIAILLVYNVNSTLLVGFIWFKTIHFAYIQLSEIILRMFLSENTHSAENWSKVLCISSVA